MVYYVLLLRNSIVKKQIIVIPAIALIFATVALAIVTSGLLTNQERTPTSSILTSVGTGAFVDQTATVNCTKIDWGTLYPNDTANRTIYIKNLGNTAETLHFSASDWNPANAGSIITLTCDKEGVLLPEGSIMKVTLTLTVSKDIGDVSDFSFNVIVDSSA